MKPDIMKEWELAKKRAAEIATGFSEVKEKGIQPVDKVVYIERMYNIHKRSLPVGIDKIVYFNVPLKTANMLCDKFLVSKSYTDVTLNTKTLIYYDIIPVDAVPREKNVYYNPSESATRLHVQPVELNTGEGETPWIR